MVSKIEKGTIKVVWMGRNNKRLFSKMFEDLNKADNFGKTKKDYLIFKLIKNKKMEEFEWEILPNGRYKTYLFVIDNYIKYKLRFKVFIERLFK